MKWRFERKRIVEPQPPYGWSGNYQSWEEAAALCDGYGKEEILERCKNSLLKVKNGEAMYERDSVLFDEIQYSWPLVAALLKIALENDGKLCVLDFGGSLGSSFYQNRNFLQDCRHLMWCIVEQQRFVECGKEYFETDELHFFPNLEDCISTNKPDVVLLSSVLQYLAEPYKFITKISAFEIPYIFVDCMPFNAVPEDRLTIQRVPPQIYDASYPCWFLNYDKVLNVLSNNYLLCSSHTNEFEIKLDNQRHRYRGFFLQHKK